VLAPGLYTVLVALTLGDALANAEIATAQVRISG
jgi:hypothetical protein